MNVFHLFWIVPLAWLIGIGTAAFGMTAKRADEDHDFYEDAEWTKI